jgi:hypothetical protein
MKYQDSEDYCDDPDTATGESFVIKGRTDDGQVIIEMDIDTDIMDMLKNHAERTGKTVSMLVGEVIDEYTMAVFRECPYLWEVMEFREAFGPGLDD